MTDCIAIKFVPHGIRTGDPRSSAVRSGHGWIEQRIEEFTIANPPFVQLMIVNVEVVAVHAVVNQTLILNFDRWPRSVALTLNL